MAADFPSLCRSQDKVLLRGQGTLLPSSPLGVLSVSELVLQPLCASAQAFVK